MPLSDDTPKGRPALISRRHFVVGGLLAGVAAASYARMPIKPDRRIPPGTLEALMPGRVGTWTFASASGVVLPPPDAISDRLYDNLVARTYTAPDKPPVMLIVAYSNAQDGLLEVHRPEFCYTAGGFELSPTVKLGIVDSFGERHKANAFVATARDRTEQVLYWTRIGQSFPQSWAQQRIAVVRSNLHRITPDGLLARLSLLDDDRGRGLTLKQFVSAVDRSAPPRLQDILFGRRERLAGPNANFPRSGAEYG